jgi:hypothetical protein
MAPSGYNVASMPSDSANRSVSVSQRWGRTLLPVALVAIFVAIVLLSHLQMSQTFDEGFHLAAGYRYLQCGDFGINSEHPPLVKMVAALALRLTHTPRPSAGVCGKEETTKDHGYSLGFVYLYKQGLDAQRVLFKGRAATVVFAIVLLFFVFLYAQYLFGYLPAIVALLLAVSEPTLIAHADLVTTDMGASAGLLAAVFLLDRYLRMRTGSRLGSRGQALGCNCCAHRHSTRHRRRTDARPRGCTHAATLVAFGWCPCPHIAHWSWRPVGNVRFPLLATP